MRIRLQPSTAIWSSLLLRLNTFLGCGSQRFWNCLVTCQVCSVILIVLFCSPAYVGNKAILNALLLVVQAIFHVWQHTTCLYLIVGCPLQLEPTRDSRTPGSYPFLFSPSAPSLAIGSLSQTSS